MKPEFRLVEIVNRYINPEWVATHGITEVRDVYLYDASQEHYCCELTPSYALYYLRSNIDGPDDETRADLEDDLARDSAWLQYTHCRDVDKLAFVPAAMTTQMILGDSYAELLEQVIEYNNANHVI